jgi:hypothetical protein
VTLDGHDGLYLELTAPDLDFDDCLEGDVQCWDSAPGGSRYTDQAHAVDRVWILDVDGARVVFNTFTVASVSTAEADELAAIVESVRFVGP